MQKAPKIVIDRLGAEMLVVHHPDADMLTAYSENSLSKIDRGIVLEHLGRCSDCREIVALALPEPDHEKQIVEGSAVGGWFTWPTLRWGFVMAGLLIVAFSALQYQRRSRMASLDVYRSAPPPIVDETKNEARTSAALTDADKEREKAPVSSPSPKQMASGAADKAAPLPQERVIVPGQELPATGKTIVAPSSLAALQHGPRVNQLNQSQLNQNQVNQSNQLDRTAQQNVAVSETIVNPPYAPARGEIHDGRTAASASVGPVTTESAGMNGRDLTQLQPLESQRPDQQPQEGGQAESKADQLKPLNGVVISNTPTVVKPAPGQAVAAVQRAGAPSWTISSTGRLRRSFDQGHTWHDVNVTNSALAANTASYELSTDVKKASSPADKEEKDKAVFEKSTMAPPLIFRAVAANGADVWAGGSAGVLYHSSDAGGHWLLVVPFSGNASLTGDIVSVVFDDLQHGKVTTSTPETWMTSDAGKTWQKQ